MRTSPASASPRRILVTGAGGYVGSRLVTALLDDPMNAEALLTLVDQAPLQNTDPRVRIVSGTLADPATIAAAVGDGAQLVFHLASVLGGAAQVNPAAARRINVDASLALFERLRDTRQIPRVVFASSIAVFGAPLPDRVDDSTPPRPDSEYGAHKTQVEAALAQYTTRGELDGLSVRLPGIVANAAADARLKSAFLSHVFHACARGEDMTMPVSPGGTAWLLSVSACVQALVHAGRISASSIGSDRTITLPALRVSMRTLVDALAKKFPLSRTRIEFAPDPLLDAQFASQPPLSTRAADRMGFRHDGDLDSLLGNAFA